MCLRTVGVQVVMVWRRKGVRGGKGLHELDDRVLSRISIKQAKRDG